MKRRHLLWALAAVLVVVAGAFLFTVFGTHRITLTEAQVQERVAPQIGKEFPVKGKAGLLIKTVTIENAEVGIGDGLVSVLFTVQGSLRLEKEFTLTAFAVGVPEYASGAFYFRPSQVEVREFAYQGNTPGEAIKNFADKYITNEGLNALVTDSAGKVEEWVTDLAQAAAVHMLDKRPVYELKDDLKGFVISAALQSVEVKENTLVITFSLLQLTISALFGLLILVAAIALAVGLLMNPEIGLALLFFSSIN